jgi:hypothetical protein
MFSHDIVPMRITPTKLAPSREPRPLALTACAMIETEKPDLTLMLLGLRSRGTMCRT